MVAVSIEEISAGMIVHLSPEILKALGGCEVKCPKGTEVQSDHYFLITEIAADNKLLATPLYSENGGIRDRVLLKETCKTGKPDQWIGQDSYYFKWQFWRIPATSVSAASVKDNSEPNNRRGYQDYKPVMADLPRLRENWRDPNSN
jgi:hypothetical protein